MRQVINFNTKWAFSKEATAVPATMPEKWYWVSLPHTWNDIDGQDGGNDLYRGTAFYAKELEKTRAKLNQIISEQTGKSVEQVAKDTERDYWLDANQAVTYGLISKIITTRKDLSK